MKSGFVYIMTNKNNAVVYTGVTSDLVNRVFQHRNRLGSKRSFCYRYNLTKLVYYECIDNISAAIIREKRLKGKSRDKKLKLISDFNNNWIDLYETLV